MGHNIKPEHKATILSEALPYIKKFFGKKKSKKGLDAFAPWWLQKYSLVEVSTFTIFDFETNITAKSPSMITRKKMTTWLFIL